MKRKQIVLIFTLCSIPFFMGCEPETTPSVNCGPTNCSGCCDPFGNCHTDASNSFCGLNGGACDSCDATESCLNGICTPSATCDSTNCTTCCQGTYCVPAVNYQTCGANGSKCENCGPGWICNASGSCEYASTQCNNTNCAGCCDGDTCITNTTAQQCGKLGQTCYPCPISGSECPSGECVQSGCGDACKTANGCCSNNQCMPGNTSDACGNAGDPCQQCNGTEVCDNGECKTLQSQCDYTNCTFGCCNAEGCQNSSFNTCGRLGLGCKQCDAGETCNAFGFCVEEECDSSNCNGCCDGNICIPTAQQDATKCGASGAACTACQPGTACDTNINPTIGGYCRSTDPACATCTGPHCCDGSTCYLASDYSCGYNGSICKNCKTLGSTYYCDTSTGTCLDAAADRQIKICVTEATIDCNPTTGHSGCTDEVTQEPDDIGIQVGLSLGTDSGATSEKQHASLDGSYVATITWTNDCPITVSSKDVENTGISVTIYEVDDFFDDTVDTCLLKLPADQLVGAVTFKCGTYSTFTVQFTTP